MFKRSILLILFLVIAAGYSFGCGLQPSRGAKSKTIVVPGGTVVPNIQVGFDANYDPSLDNVIPGYKIMTVAFTNNSMRLIQMDPIKDRWFVENRRGRKIRAITNLRDKDPDTWQALPKRLKILIEYPLLIPVGSTQTIDLLFKDKVNLEAFKSVIFRASNTKNKFKILPREG